MKTLKNISDEDIFENPIQPVSEYKKRPTVKAIILDVENNIAILKTRGHYLLPGGGIEENENIITALEREMREEIGCVITDIKVFAISHQYRNKFMRDYETTFFIAKVLGTKGTATTTQEDELSTEIFWYSKETILKLLESQITTTDENEYEFCFNARSHFDAFKEFCNLEIA